MFARLKNRAELEAVSSWKLQLGITAFGLFLIIVTWQPVQTPDWNRFESQALSLLEGDGYKTFGVSETALPPGYPVLIASFYSLGGSEQAVLYFQVFLLLFAFNLIYLALKPVNKNGAAFAALALAAHPFIARSASYYLSEAFGIFLCSLLVFFLSKILRRKAKLWEFGFFGLAVISLPLNSPALIFVSFFVGTYVVVIERRNLLAIFSILFGVSVLFGPWQVHCAQANGRLCTTFYSTTVFENNTHFYAWYKSWAARQSDLKVYFRPAENIHEAPERAFDSDAQQAIIIAAVASPLKESEDLFQKISDQRIASDPLKYYITLPLVRSINLWFDMNQLGHVQMEYVARLLPRSFMEDLRSESTERAVKRYFKALLSSGVYFYYISFSLALFWITAAALRKRCLIALLIMLGVFIYTVVAGHTAFIEARRNLVFLPIIIFLVFWLMGSLRTGKGNGERMSTTRLKTKLC